MRHFILSILLLATSFVYFLFINPSGKELLNEHNLSEEGPVNFAVHTNNTTTSNYLINYQNIGFKNWAGAINCLVISESDSNHLIAGAQNGGLWISDNRGKTWSIVNDYATTLRVTSIAQNHFRHNEYYYSTGVDIYDHGILLNDIYRSTDGGHTFTNIITTTSPVFGRIDKIVCSPLDANTVYFSQRASPHGTPGGLFRTTDNFNTWQKVLPLTTTGSLDDFIVLPDGEVQVCSYNLIWKSPNGNAGSFVLSNFGIGSHVSWLKLSACLSQPLIRYAGAAFGNYHGIYKSIDGGINWTFLDTLGIGGGNPGVVAVKPNNPDLVFFGMATLQVSLDGGHTWQYSWGGTDFRSINYDPNREGIVFLTSDFGINSLEVEPVTPSSFITETTYDSTLFVQEIYIGDYSINGTMSSTGMQDLGSKLLTNNFELSFLTGADGSYNFCSKQDSNIAYCSMQGGMIVRITNLTGIPVSQYILNQMDANGDYQIDEGATFIHPFKMNNADHQQLYFPTMKRLWRSINGGTNWIPVSNYYGNPGYKFSITTSESPNPIVYWSNEDSVFVLPRAATAAPQSEFGFPSPASSLKNIFADPNNDSCIFYIAAGLPAQILHSSNLLLGNITWTNIAANFPQDVTPLCITAYPGNEQIMLAGTFEGGIYITLDGGQSWSKENDFPNVQVRDIKIRPSDKKIFIYSYGRGAWIADFATSVSIPENTFIELKVFPNPYTDALNIELPFTIQNAELTITGLNGNIVYKQSLNSIKQLRINLESYSPGFYFLKIADKNKILFSKKLIKTN